MNSVTNEHEPQLIIRQFTSVDQSRVQELFSNGLLSYGRDDPSLLKLQQWFIAQKLAENGDMYDIASYYLQPNRNFWVAEINSIIVGCVAVTTPEDNDSNECELVRMSVDENYRKLGIASKLIQILENWSKEHNYNKIRLTTLSKMFPAIQLYEKNGFIIEKNEEIDLIKYDLGIIVITHLTKVIN